MNENKSTGTVSRRVLLAAAPLGAAGVALMGTPAGASPPPAETLPLPERRILGVPYEDITEGTDHLRTLAGRLEETGINEVGIAIGRVEWSLFPSSDKEFWSDGVQKGDGRDLVAEAITELTPSSTGDRGVVLILDCLVPNLTEKKPELAGVNSEGVRQRSPGLAAVARGEVGDKIVALARDAAARYHPTAISLTELFLEDTYSEHDLEDFRRQTGEDDWPRDPEGSIDASSDVVVRWRCDALTSLVSRVREVVNEEDVELWMEVKAPKTDPNGDRPDSGQNYEMLDGAADRLVLWNYFDEITPESPSTYDLAKVWATRDGGSGIFSVGLWGPTDEHGVSTTISPEKLKTAVEEAARGGSTSVWVIPAALMTDDHWAALAEVWKP